MTEETYTCHVLTDVEYPAYYGLPPELKGTGLIRATVNSTGQRGTFIVDASYASMIRAAREDSLEDPILSATAVRWLRLGWPEEWTPGRAPGQWAQVYPEGWAGLG